MLSPHPSLSQNRLWLPRLSLTSCIRSIVSRSTVGIALPAGQRMNFFPATPLCSISWMFAGSSERYESSVPDSPDSPRRQMPSALMFAGPQSQPSSTWNPGPGHGMMLMLLPDALQQLTGIEPAAWVNRYVDARGLLPADWVRCCEAVVDAPDDDARVRMLEDFIDPLWQARRPQQPFNAQRLQDWSQGLAMRAACSPTGRGLRQVERRIKQWAGLPMRELQGMARAEQAFFQIMEAEAQSTLHWPDMAADCGYADQSHLCRVTRRITGFAPEALRQRIARDEAFWIYRLWMES